MPRASNVFEAAAVCEPDLALEAGHEWYVDLSPFRGTNVVRRIHRAIKSKETAVATGLPLGDQGFARQLLTGLRGSGKTTELNQLGGALAGDGYFPVLISGVRELNLEQLTSIELLMSFVWSLHDAPPVGTFHLNLPRRAVEDLSLSIASVLVEATDREQAEVKLSAEVGLSASIPLYVKVKTALKSMLAVSTEQSRTVKAKIVQRASTFITTLNRIIDDVQADLQHQGCKGLVYLVDELDRLPPRTAEGYEKLTVAEVLFDLQASELKAPHAHIVYTFPSQLFVSVNLGRSWSERPLLIPAVKIAHKGGGEYEPGRDALGHLIEARVEVDRVLQSRDLLVELVRFSGGYPRDLLRLVRYAANRTDTMIGPAEVTGARRDLIAEYDRLVAPSLLAPLTAVERERRVPPDPAYGELLERNLVLTYWNDEEWADLHPAVRETPGYRAHTPLTGK